MTEAVKLEVHDAFHDEGYDDVLVLDQITLLIDIPSCTPRMNTQDALTAPMQGKFNNLGIVKIGSIPKPID